ncbi:MAG: CHRD domain-containing protein, partial [Verrucomicrobiales bacterium]|nr:CHRD domain-containing protein [Verrucomicrobiales bacterium]
SGANERPTPVTSAGRGTAHLLLVGDSLWLNATYRGLSGVATLAHLHGPAGVDASAGVLVDLAPLNGGGFGADGTFAGRLTLTPEVLAGVVDGLTYLNVHTDANKPGEIRGQVVSAIAP